MIPITWTWAIIGKIILAVVAAGLLTFGYQKVQGYFVGVDNLHVQLGNERDRANRAEVSLGALEQTIELREEHATALVEIRADAQASIDAIRAESDKNKEVLVDKERLKKLTIAKPKLLERMGNRATEKVFENLESIYND